MQVTDEMVKAAAIALGRAIVSQPRSGAEFDEQDLVISDPDSNSFWDVCPAVEAALVAALKAREAGK